MGNNVAKRKRDQQGRVGQMRYEQLCPDGLLTGKAVICQPPADGKRKE